MKSQNSRITLDDYARHLRRVTLTTLLICAGLVIGSILSVSSSLRSGYSDLEIISESIEKLDENWLYDYAIEIVEGRFGRLGADLPRSIFVNLPLKEGPVLVEIQLPKDKWMVAATEECGFFGYSSRNTLTHKIAVYITHKLKSDKDSRLEAVKTKLKMQMVKPATVSGFKKLWDFLSGPHHTYCASGFGESAILRISHPETEGDETHECRIILEKPEGHYAGEWKFTAELEGVQEEADLPKDGFQMDDTRFIRMCAVNEFYIWVEEQRFFWEKKRVKAGEEKYRLEVPISCVRQQVLPLRELMRITGMKRAEVSFELAFPELNEYIERYPNMSYASLRTLLQELIHSGREYFEVFGITVPSIYLTYCGLAVIICMSSYLVLHLNELVLLGSTKTWECSTAWIATYHSVWAKLTTIISIIIVPLCVVMYLSSMAYSGMGLGIAKAIILLSVAVQGFLSIVTLRGLVRLWRVIRR
jgi:hypothetical protein